MYKSLLLLPFMLFLSMCGNDDDGDLDCSAVTCPANLSKLYFEIVDGASGENVLVSMQYDENDFEVTGGENVRLEIEEVFEKRLLVLSDQEWKIGEFDYSFSADETQTFDIGVELNRTGGSGCCAHRLYLEGLEVDGNNREITDSLQIITLVLN